MDTARTHAKEAFEDIFFGQVVIIWARWFLIAAGAVLTIWTTRQTAHLAVAVIPITALMAINFYLHGRYLTERPCNDLLVAAASAFDLAVITVLVVFWNDSGVISSGLASPFFVFYYPMLLAVAFVLPPRPAVAYTIGTVVVYAVVCVPDVASAVDAKALLLRLVTMAAMGGLGTFYWRIQRDRRRAALAR